MPLLMRKDLSERARTAGVGKRQRHAADDLAGFMSLAGNEKTVVWAEHRKGPADRQALSPISSTLSKPFVPRRMAVRIAAGSSDRGCRR